MTKASKITYTAVFAAVSYTHLLLQKALRKVLGDHVEQAGSYTANDHIRFDFTHFAALTPEELAQVENLVNEAILAGSPVITEEMSIDEAKKKMCIRDRPTPMRLSCATGTARKR